VTLVNKLVNNPSSETGWIDLFKSTNKDITGYESSKTLADVYN